jgi:putative Mg2+ transporter-C (MgtC) family protein
MQQLSAWLGDLNDLPALGNLGAGLICVLASIVCGTLLGLERERRYKPAGLRTVTLIALGSTIYTMLSLLLAERKEMADPARLAAQIIPGIGFLGAGAIIQARGTVVGLTTAATIWTTAAIGVTIGIGQVAAGVGLTALTLVSLELLRRVEGRLYGPCDLRRVVVSYEGQAGKARPVLTDILDRLHIVHASPEQADLVGDEQRFAFEVCVRHAEHRAVLRELAERKEVTALDVAD